MYIIIALSAQGWQQQQAGSPTNYSAGSTQSSGVTKLNPYINVTDFFVGQVRQCPALIHASSRCKVLPELRAPSNAIVTADCLKFLTLFRNQARSHDHMFALQRIAAAE